MQSQLNLRGDRQLVRTGIQVWSCAFEHGAVIPSENSREGGNVSPDLRWAGVPVQARELLLMMEDPDASRRTLLHWLVSGIEPACVEIGAGETPDGGRVWCNDFGDVGYGGPHPPPGDRPHRYFIRLFALATPARLPRHPSAADVHRAIRGTALASGALVGRYAR